MPEEIEPQSAAEPARSDAPDRQRSEKGPAVQGPAAQPVSGLNWRLVAWGGLVVCFAVAASELTSLWWLVLVFGLLVPVISALQTRRSADREVGPEIRPQDKEAELLGVLSELGELTPTTAAMRTSLTVEEAAGMLEKLARNGHLEARTQGAVVIYGLWDPDRRELVEGDVGPAGAVENEAPRPSRPDDP